MNCHPEWTRERPSKPGWYIARYLAGSWAMGFKPFRIDTRGRWYGLPKDYRRIIKGGVFVEYARTEKP